jgi:hypothetical protein
VDRKDFFEQSVEKYDVWNDQHLRSAGDVLPGVTPVSLDVDALDGAHWQHYGTSRQ